ncbi:hypothetical protein WL34_24140 [Burkholderia cepacia]|nr:hypothetical protein WL34_24140 [Burkholderia cepacia]
MIGAARRRPFPDEGRPANAGGDAIRSGRIGEPGRKSGTAPDPPACYRTRFAATAATPAPAPTPARAACARWQLTQNL